MHKRYLSSLVISVVHEPTLNDLRFPEALAEGLSKSEGLAIRA
ncbi:MAG TPA: hypothetical protein O0X39_08050 [Methanocorpusculum sp.]|nr:hypothetical protein [Methanocorpusculum sp.]